MIEVKGNLWDYPADFICIPTNGVINKDGLAIMGLGIAKQATLIYPWVRRKLGRNIKDYGNHTKIISTYSPLISFPTKHHWKEKADLTLIKRSALELKNIIYLYEQEYIYVLPRPGCGAGHLSWDDVKPVIEFLPDNVNVINL